MTNAWRGARGKNKQRKEKRKSDEYLSERRPGTDKFQDDSMGILLDTRRNNSVHHDLTQFVAPGSDVVHHHLVGRQFVFDGLAGALADAGRFQFHAVAQLTDHLHPQFRLLGHTCNETDNN